MLRGIICTVTSSLLALTSPLKLLSGRPVEKRNFEGIYRSNPTDSSITFIVCPLLFSVLAGAKLHLSRGFIRLHVNDVELRALVHWAFRYLLTDSGISKRLSMGRCFRLRICRSAWTPIETVATDWHPKQPFWRRQAHCLLMVLFSLMVEDEG